MLTGFKVLTEDAFGLHPSGPHRNVSLYCFDGNRMVLVLILQEAVEHHFHKRKLTREDGNRLVRGDLKAIETLISEKYMLGEVEDYTPSDGGRTFPLVFVNIPDVNRIPPNGYRRVSVR